MSEKIEYAPEDEKNRGNTLRDLIREFLAAMVYSRPEPGYRLPITKEGKSLREHGLRGLGYRINEEGDLEKIPEAELHSEEEN